MMQVVCVRGFIDEAFQSLNGFCSFTVQSTRGGRCPKLPPTARVGDDMGQSFISDASSCTKVPLAFCFPITKVRPTLRTPSGDATSSRDGACRKRLAPSQLRRTHQARRSSQAQDPIRCLRTVRTPTAAPHGSAQWPSPPDLPKAEALRRSGQSGREQDQSSEHRGASDWPRDRCLSRIRSPPAAQNASGEAQSRKTEQVSPNLHLGAAASGKPDANALSGGPAN